MKTDEMLLEIEQCSKYGTPLLTNHAVCILAKIRAAEDLANDLSTYDSDKLTFQTCFLLKEYKIAGGGDERKINK